jgi:hypothetical protein
MVGADRFDESAGERGAPDPDPGLGAGFGSVRVDEPTDDSYWSSIDYPEPRPRPDVSVGARSVARARRAPRALIASFVAAVLVVGSGAYAVGHMNGRAPVPGLQRQVDAQRSELRSRAATIAAQARTLAADEAQLRSLRAQVSQSAATRTACRNAIAAADRAFGTESDALHALATSDFATATSLTDRFGIELDEYGRARSTCLGPDPTV